MKIAINRNNKMCEIEAYVIDKDMDLYFKKLKDVNFEDYYQGQIYSETKHIVIPDDRPKSILKNTKEVISTLEDISDKPIMDFSLLVNLLESNSMMNNPKLIQSLREYIELYQYERVLDYNQYELSNVLRRLMQKDQRLADNFSKMILTTDTNTIFLEKINKTSIGKQLTYNKFNSRM